MLYVAVVFVLLMQKLSCCQEEHLACKQLHSKPSDADEPEITRMWANAQTDGRPAKHRLHTVQRRKVWLTPTTRCRAVTLPRRKTR